MEPRLSPWARRWIGRIGAAAAFLGIVLGAYAVVLHVTTDPLSDVRAYYDAGARLNAGQPLYLQAADTNDPAFYRYPPLLAIVFRPLATLPFEVAAVIWEVIVGAALVATLWRLGLDRRTTWLALAILAAPTAWAVAIGQAQAVVTFLMVLGAPWAIALATNLKLLPALAAIWWLGRRDLRRLAQFAGSLAGLAAIQLALEPNGSLAYPGFLRLDQVGEVRNLSPYELSPILWAGLVVAGGLVTLRLARTRWGWPAAVAFSVLASPRLLQYQLTTLLAGLQSPPARSPGEPDPKAAG